ncbi:hypothetical protein PMNALOAF_2769 [Methylobacterium adhaesivum]|uniref:Phage protein n=1 Tax=Methylobacterium adhaesivum TaxID=333297 RepID=A0ABT8BIX5_9HYPH|nr:hypothetical protein [Methylobacterium adhaesivum]MDN3592122.1 hypothetical protein [Methylobacterium adhaesivum]GJD31510.1 hypothetical protein PMNALOAF_2769 [Methylobacterium adhaesivum]
MTRGGFTLEDILEMEIEDFNGWAKAAFEYREELNRAIAKANKRKRGK